MTHPPSTQRRVSGRRRQKSGASFSTALAVQGVVAILLLGLVVVILASKWPSETPKEQAAPATSAAPSATLNADDGSGTGSGSASGQKVLRLGDHPVLLDPDAGLQNIVCDLPRWAGDQAAAEAFFTAATRCLNAAWQPFLTYYHLPFVAPQLHFPTTASFQTACGTIAVGVATAAYYCDNNLYVPYRGLQIDQYGDNPGVYLALIAHEYGHHVQEIAGIMDAVWQKIYQSGQVSPAGLDLARRKELQAQCFSGMFLGAVVDRGGSINRDMYAKAWRDQDTRGDNTSGSHDHGTNAHYASWWRLGAQYNRIAKCNTFTASSADVS
jgi:predicted metalloprotease